MSRALTTTSSKVLFALILCLTLRPMLRAQDRVRETPRDDSRSPTTSSPRHKSGLEVVNDAALESRTDQLREVKLLTDTIFDRFAFVPVPPDQPLRDRIAAAELAYRRGSHKAITEAQAVKAMNQLARFAMAPEWARTNEAQIHLFRTMLKPYVPQLVGREPFQKLGQPPWAISDAMSPAEALLVTMYLATGKVLSPEYQIGPNEWVQYMRRLTNGTEKAADSTRARVSKVDPEIALFKDIVEFGLRDRNSEISSQANEFLDMLGIKR
jgi:hypothetical protein